MWAVQRSGLQRAVPVRSIVLDASGHSDGYPFSYEVQVSEDGIRWSQLVATGYGEPLTRIHLEQLAAGKFMHVTMTGNKGWKACVIHNLELYGSEGKS